MIFTVNQFL